MEECKYVVSIQDHTNMIVKVVESVIAETTATGNINNLRHQLKTYQGGWEGSCYVDKSIVQNYSPIEAMPTMEYFKGDSSELGQLTIKEVPTYAHCDL